MAFGFFLVLLELMIFYCSNFGSEVVEFQLLCCLVYLPMDYFRLVSDKTKDALKHEGRVIATNLSREHGCNLITRYLLVAHLCSLVPGLLDFPKMWWTATQGALFSGSPEVSRQVKLSA